MLNEDMDPEMTHEDVLQLLCDAQEYNELPVRHNEDVENRYVPRKESVISASSFIKLFPHGALKNDLNIFAINANDENKTKNLGLSSYEFVVLVTGFNQPDN